MVTDILRLLYPPKRLEIVYWLCCSVHTGVDVQADQCAASGLAVADGFWPLRRLKKKAILEKVPLFVIGGIAAVITYISQSRSAAVTLPSDYGL